jgi:hypothetical protein
MFAKLQLKAGQRLAVSGLPKGVELGLETVPLGSSPAAADAIMVFVRSTAELGEVAEPAIAAARQDALCWIAYPKAGQLDTDLNRDSLAAAVGAEGVTPVRQISIDAVWSALRLRPR